MNDLQRLVIENECRRLMLLYCWHIDHLDPDAFANLWADDAAYKPSIEPVPLVGRASIRQWAQAYPKDVVARHVSTNQLVEVIDEDHAAGVSYAVVWREPEPTADGVSTNVIPRSLVEYVDEFRRTEEGWRFSSRVYRMLFLQDSATVRPTPWPDFPPTAGSLRL